MLNGTSRVSSPGQSMLQFGRLFPASPCAVLMRCEQNRTNRNSSNRLAAEAVIFDVCRTYDFRQLTGPVRLIGGDHVADVPKGAIEYRFRRSSNALSKSLEHELDHYIKRHVDNAWHANGELI